MSSNKRKNLSPLSTVYIDKHNENNPDIIINFFFFFLEVKELGIMSWLTCHVRNTIHLPSNLMALYCLA